ncbi:MAG: PTS sugar transporter subunit IIA [Solobacterium sp.]|nr:PTS sugar transporter subunit IIA [Solobacterium sp.]
MTGIIITGHGAFASGLSANVKLLAGNTVELTALDFTDQKTPEVLEEEISAAIKNYDSASVIIILTDIMGGTPYMKAAALSTGNPKVRVISGANAPLLLDLVIRNMSGNAAEDPDELAESLLNTGREALTIYHFEPVQNEEPEDGDGI